MCNAELPRHDALVREVHELVVNAIIVWGSVVGVVALWVALARIDPSSPVSAYGVHLLCYVAILVTALVRHRLSLIHRTWIVLALILVDSLSLLLTNDVIALPELLLCLGAMVAGQVLGERCGWIFVGAGSMLVVAGAAMGPITGITEADVRWAGDMVLGLGAFALVASLAVMSQARVTATLSEAIAEQESQRALLVAMNAQLIRSRDDANQASIAKSRFVANVSHQLRTPLAAIIGFADLVAHSAGDTRYVRAQIADLRLAAAELQDTIEQLLSVARVRDDSEPLQLKETDSREMLARVADVVRHKLRERGIRFRMHVGENVPGMVRTVPDKLVAALRQIVDNAERYTDAGTVQVSLSVSESSSSLVLDVVDTGVGIPQDELERLWEPFEQVTIGSEGRGGSGLGLSIARSEIAALGGTIEVDSTVGQGTTVRVMVPYEVAGELGIPTDAISVYQTGSFVALASPAALTGPLRQRLSVAVDRGDYFAVCDMLPAIREQSPAAADHVKRLIEAFDYGGLARWLTLMDGQATG